MVNDYVRLLVAAVGCAAGWTLAYKIMCYGGNTMVKDFLASKFGRSCVALAAGVLAPAVPALIMGDTHAFRMALSSAAGGLVALLALHFKSEAEPK